VKRNIASRCIITQVDLLLKETHRYGAARNTCSSSASCSCAASSNLFVLPHYQKSVQQKKQESWFFDNADVTMPACIMFCCTRALFYFVYGDASWEITAYCSFYCWADFSQFESLFDWRVLVAIPLLAITSRIITENHSFYKRIPMFVVKFVVKWIWATPIVSPNFVREMVILYRVVQDL
jgi:hypothetical protein